MPKLVFRPAVYPIAYSVLDEEALKNWAGDHDHLGSAFDTSTPLGNIIDRASWIEQGPDLIPEFAGRFCYRSFDKGRPSNEYVANILGEAHGSVLEHTSVSFAISGVSRSLTHELIRHRAGTAISQESQRYVDAKDIRFVVPPLLMQAAGWDGMSFATPSLIADFERDCGQALLRYEEWRNSFRNEIEVLERAGDVKLATMKKKRALEAARALLPNAAETRLVWTMNLRAARHVCELRGSEHADLEIRRLAVALTRQMKDVTPLAFADFEIITAADGLEAVRCTHHKV